jgi:hypothetical protein
VIESIIAKHKDNAELSDYIDTLAKDWFTINWDHSTRNKKGEPIALPAGAGYGYGVDPAAAYGPAGGISAGAGPVPTLQGAYGGPQAAAAALPAAGYGAGAAYGAQGYGGPAGY